MRWLAVALDARHLGALVLASVLYMVAGACAIIGAAAIVPVRRVR